MLFGMLPEAKSKCVSHMAAACKGHAASSVTSEANNETDEAGCGSGSSGTFVLSLIGRGLSPEANKFDSCLGILGDWVALKVVQRTEVGGPRSWG